MQGETDLLAKFRKVTGTSSTIQQEMEGGGNSSKLIDQAK